MASFKLEKYTIYITALPVQTVTKTGENGRAFTVNSTEMFGDHRAVILYSDPNGQFAVVAPLTSATDDDGKEKWHVIPKTWLRVTHKGLPTYILTEQVRYCDRSRFRKQEGILGEYDQKQLDLRLRVMFELV